MKYALSYLNVIFIVDGRESILMRARLMEKVD